MKEAIIFILLCFVGILIEIIATKVYSKLTNQNLKIHRQFSWPGYIGLLVVPIWGFLYLLITQGRVIVYFFFIFAILGPFFEYLLGLLSHRLVGVKLWSYYQYDIQGYTSWLTIPLWGLGGLVLWATCRILGLI